MPRSIHFEPGARLSLVFEAQGAATTMAGGYMSALGGLGSSYQSIYFMVRTFSRFISPLVRPLTRFLLLR